MAEIIYRIPSAVPYAYVEVHVSDLSELPDPAMLAAQYAAYYDAYSREEKAAIQRALGAPQADSQEAPPGDPQVAAQRLAGGRKPRTADEASEMAVQLIKSELGAVEVAEHDEAEDCKNNSNKAPWDQPAAEAKPKPWETEGW